MVDSPTTWRDLILQEMKARADTWSHSTICTADEDFLESAAYFNCMKQENGDVAFTLWTDNFVYFATLYDDYSGVGSVPRNPGGQLGTPTVNVNGNTFSG